MDPEFYNHPLLIGLGGPYNSNYPGSSDRLSPSSQWEQEAIQLP